MKNLDVTRLVPWPLFHPEAQAPPFPLVNKAGVIDFFLFNHLSGGSHGDL